MKTITDDPEGFFESGGWTFLDPESDAEDAADEESEEEDEVYRPSDVEGDEGSEWSDEDSEYSEGDTEDDDGDASEDLGKKMLLYKFLFLSRLL